MGPEYTLIRDWHSVTLGDVEASINHGRISFTSGYRDTWHDRQDVVTRTLHQAAEARFGMVFRCNMWNIYSGSMLQGVIGSHHDGGCGSIAIISIGSDASLHLEPCFQGRWPAPPGSRPETMTLYSGDLLFLPRRTNYGWTHSLDITGPRASLVVREWGVGSYAPPDPTYPTGLLPCRHRN